MSGQIQFNRNTRYSHVAGIVNAAVVVVHEYKVANGHLVRPEAKVNRTIHVVIIQRAGVTCLILPGRLRTRRQRDHIRYNTTIIGRILTVVVIISPVTAVGTRNTCLVQQRLASVEV